MQTRKLSLDCPACGSASVVYTCEPKCCFNHACAHCSATFEPVTEKAGGKLNGAIPPNPPPDSSDPTVACASCESTNVYQLDDGRLVCTDCGALLRLEITEVAAG